MSISSSCGEPRSHAQRTIEEAWARLPAPLRKPVVPPPELLGAIPEELRGVYFETHFASDPDGDFRDLLLQVPLYKLPCPNGRSGVVCDTARRLHGWFARSALAYHCQPHAWLELDDVATGWRPRSPGVSICVDPLFELHRPPTLGPGLGASSLRRLLEELEDACGVSSVASSTFERVARAWPARGRVRHISVMGGRAEQPRKLYGLLPREELLPFLRRIDWPGSLELVVDLQSALPEALPNIHLDLTVMGANLLPRLAFEFFSDPPPYSDFGRTELLAVARGRRLLSAAAAQLLQGWCDSGSAGRSGRRWFDLKFVVDGERPSLKAYLGAQPAAEYQ